MHCSREMMKFYITLKLYLKIHTVDFIKCNIIRFNIKPRDIILKNKILINTSYHWSHSWVEYLFFTRVKNRENLIALVCDGLPYCEREIITLPRPSCRACIKNTTQKLKAFDINYALLSDYVSESERVDILLSTDNLQSKDIKNLIEGNVKIGQYSIANLFHYMKGVVEINDNYKILKSILVSAKIIHRATEKIKHLKNLDKLVTTNGKYIQSGIAIDIFNRDKLNYITWDAFAQGDKIIFSRNSVAHDQLIKRDIILDSPLLNENQKSWVTSYFRLQSLSANMPYKLYSETSLNDKKSFNQLIERCKNKKIIAFYTNVEWDSTAMGRETIFSSMREALNFLINFTNNNHDYVLIIRIHPGEEKVPLHLKTKNTIRNYLDSVLTGDLSRIEIIDSESNIKSYDIAEHVDFNVVYTSTLGLELPLMGIKPIVLANPYYSGFGFTQDPTSFDEIEDYFLLGYKKSLNSKEIELAIKVGYFSKSVRLFNINCLSKNKFKTYEYLNGSCDRIIYNFGQFLTGRINEFEISN